MVPSSPILGEARTLNFRNGEILTDCRELAFGAFFYSSIYTPSQRSGLYRKVYGLFALSLMVKQMTLQ